MISPEDDVELRRLTLIHRGRKPRSLELTTYAEVVLAPDASDLAHPAFSNLFIQTELAPERDAILCHRRPCSPDEPAPCLFHMMVVHGDNRHNVSFETDRARFIGRGRNPANAQAIEAGGMLGNTSGSVLIRYWQFATPSFCSRGSRLRLISFMASARPVSRAWRCWRNIAITLSPIASLNWPGLTVWWYCAR